MQQTLGFRGTRLSARQLRLATTGAVFFFIGSLIWQFSNFVFNAVAAHLLGPANYGTLAAVVGLLYLANPLFVSLQTVTARITTSLDASGAQPSIRGYLLYYGVRLGFAGMLAAGFLALASGPVAKILKVPSRLPIVLLALILFLSAGTHLQRGILLGSQRFKRLGVSSAVEGLSKVLIVAVLLTWFWRTVDAAILAVILASAAGFGANWMLLRWLPKGGEAARPTTHPSRYSLVTLTTLFLLAAMLSVDVIAAHRYLSPHVAGLYAAVSLGGKITFFALSTVALYLFPKFSNRKDRGLDGRRQLALSLALVCVGASVLVTMFFLEPQLLIRPLFGSSFLPAAPYLGWMALAFGLYALTYLTAMYLLAQQKNGGAGVLAVVVLGQLLGFYSFHATVWSFIWTEVIVFFTSTALLCAVAFLSGSPGEQTAVRNNPIPA